MSGRLFEFPRRRFFAVRVLHEADDRWLVLAGEHGWVHGDWCSAIIDASWLSENLKLPVRYGCES